MENKCKFYNITLSGKAECGALSEMQCAGCNFFKTEKQFNDDLEAAEARLKAKGLRAVKKFDGEKMIMSTEKAGDEAWADSITDTERGNKGHERE